MKSIQDTITLFRKKKYRITPQRLAILKILDGNKSHPSAEEIYNQILVDHPSTSFTTVYNTLETLVSMGEIQEITIDHERKHYDPDVAPHHHAICSVCKEITDIFDPSIELSHMPDTSDNGFRVEGYKIHFGGVCAKCRKREKLN